MKVENSPSTIPKEFQEKENITDLVWKQLFKT